MCTPSACLSEALRQANGGVFNQLGIDPCLAGGLLSKFQPDKRSGCDSDSLISC